VTNVIAKIHSTSESTVMGQKVKADPRYNAVYGGGQVVAYQMGSKCPSPAVKMSLIKKTSVMTKIISFFIKRIS